MELISREKKEWLYAGTSTGRHLGSLNITAFRKVDCWEAVGPAREIFSETICPKIISFLKDNACKLQESDSIVNLSLFMVGKSVQKSRPTIIFVSKDKSVRKEAFRLVKESNILREYQGFEIGHCPLIAEFRGHRQIGEEGANMPDLPQDSSAELEDIFTESRFIKPGQLICSKSTNGRLKFATAGGFLRVSGTLLLLSVNHILSRETLGHDQILPPELHSALDEDDGSSDGYCEITGLDDLSDREDDEDLVDATSRGSASPHMSTSEYSSDTSTRDLNIPNNEQEIRIVASLYEDKNRKRSTACAADHDIACSTLPPQSHGPFWKVGEVIYESDSLDFALIRVDDYMLPSNIELLHPALPVEQNSAMLRYTLRETPVLVQTARSGVCTKGILSGISNFCRLPYSQLFEEVLSAKLETPLSAGDCGSWVFDETDKSFIGHVVAASSDNMVITIMPARSVFRHILSAQESGLLRVSKSVTTYNSPIQPYPPVATPGDLGFRTSISHKDRYQQQDEADMETKPFSSTNIITGPAGRAKHFTKAWPSRVVSAAAVPDATSKQGEARPTPTPVTKSSKRPQDQKSEWDDERWWEEDRGSFPQYCMNCEKQFVPEDDRFMYCSEACRAHDQNTPSSIPASLQPHTHLPYQSGQSHHQDIIPRTSPSRHDSMGMSPIGHTSTISALHRLSVLDGSQPLSTWPMKSLDDTGSRASLDSPATTALSSMYNNIYYDRASPGIGNPVLPRRPGASEKPKTTNITRPTMRREEAPRS